MSENADESSKTEEPTQKKLDKAHDEGQWPLTQELGIALAIGVMLALTLGVLPWLVPSIQSRLNYYIEHVVDFPMDRAAVGSLMIRSVIDILMAVWLPVTLFLFAGIYATYVQKGFALSWKSIVPKLSKINPIAGFKRLFSLPQQSVELGKSLAKMSIVAIAVYFVLKPLLENIEHFVGLDIISFVLEINENLRKILIVVLIIVSAVAAFDFFYQNYTYTKKMKMTKQEVKDEHKQSEGDPQVKARIRRIRMERAQKRMMAAVPTADVVVTNPTHFSVALKYDATSMGAPTVVAKGADNIAMRIREIAKENNVPIMANPPLARALFASVEIDQEVPPEHYRAVAEVISYVMKMRQGATPS